jgi:hypothetical protein
MAKNDNWVGVEIKNEESGEKIRLYHPPRDGAAGQDVDRQLRRILGIPSPQPAGYKPKVVVTALPGLGLADWLTKAAPGSEIADRDRA